MTYRLRFFSVVAVSLGLVFASPAYADVPAAAQLLDASANPYTSTGVRVTVSNAGSMYGIANDGTKAFIINSSGNITTVPLAPLAAVTPGSATTTAGTTHTVSWGGASPSWPGSSQGSIAYSKGCIFITSAEDDNTSLGNIDLYCIDVSDYSVTEIAVPQDKPLPKGYYFAYSNLIDFPDGRVGKVSRYEDIGGGTYRSILRLYTITGTGKNATIAWSEDIIMTDTNNWAIDEHGIGTDGTYLYRIQWKDYNPDTKVWRLAGAGATSTVIYSGEFTQPFGNMHFLAHNHVDNYYLVGHYSQNQFFITKSEDPGPGPGNPLTPTFGAVASTTDGFTVSVTNYDPDFDWSVETDDGEASIDSEGVVTVTGLPGGGSATITVMTEKSGVPDGSASLTGSAIPDDGDGVTVEIEDNAPNNGDGNGDGTDDSEQAYVTSLKNTEVSSTAYLTLEIDNTNCSALVDVSVGAAPADSGYTYPVGLLDFDATCTSGSSNTVTVYYDKQYNTSNWVARKYINGSYENINGAVFGTATVGGAMVTTLTYTLTDGGPLDADGIANGTIEDPVGPAVPSANNGSGSISASGTRFGCKDPNASNYEYFSSHKQELCRYDNGPAAASVCAPYMTGYLRYGAENDPVEVRKLETFLNEKQGEYLPIDGEYGLEDVEAVKRLQQKYASEVLGVWGLSEPTGYVYRTTIMKINSFYCSASVTCPAFTEHNSLKENSSSAEVGKTKVLLSELGFYSGAINNIFDASLDTSLKNFQLTFSETMLKPWGLTNGTGYKYKTTNKFLNMLVGCETGAVDLDGKGIFDY